MTAGDDASPDTREVSEFLARQQAERYDLALQLHGGGGNSNAFVTRLGARVTAGSRDVDAPPLDRWTRYTHHQHEVLRFLEVVALVGAEPVRLEPRLTVTDADRLAGRQVLPPVGAPLVAIHPGATDPRRRWPAASFAAVADAVAERGGAVVIVGQGADDEAAAAGIRAATAVASPLDLVGRLSLSGMLGVLERCRLLVGNDSGPRHLAAAVGTATVAVYWCGNLINAGPLTRARHRIGVSFRTACPQCGADQTRSRCAHNPSFVADVPVADVVRDALELYDSEQARAAA